MKKIFTLGLFAIGALSTLQAQISITTADLPVLGGSYVMLQDSATALSAPSTGTGQTWNYTSLTNVGSVTADFISKTGGLNAADFSGATMARTGPVTDLLGFSLPIPGGAGINAWVYYHYGTDGLLIDGFAFPANFGVVNLGDLSMVATPADISYLAPSTMGSTRSITTTYEGGQDNVSTLTDPDTLIQIDISRTITVTGSGNITTPEIANEPALLYEENATMSVSIVIMTSLGFPLLDSTLISNVPTKQYYFLGKNHGYPLMMMNEDSTGNIVGARYMDMPSGISELQNHLVSVYPNPSSNIINISLDPSMSQDAQCILTTLDGKQVLSETVHPMQIRSIDLSDLQSGIYMVSIYNADKQLIAMKKLVKE